MPADYDVEAGVPRDQIQDVKQPVKPGGLMGGLRRGLRNLSVGWLDRGRKDSDPRDRQKGGGGGGGNIAKRRTPLLMNRQPGDGVVNEGRRAQYKFPPLVVEPAAIQVTPFVSKRMRG